ncbi:MAG: flippase [Clostridiales bacterium]|nr:flippase [Clostridiales bacterium]
MSEKRSIKVNALLNVIKRILGVIFPLVTIPYVARVLKSEAYGSVNYGFSVLSFFLLFSSLGISNYAIREGGRVRNDKAKLNKLANQLFSINCISMILSYIVLICFILGFNKLFDIRYLLLCQSLMMLLQAIGTEWINVIFEDYAYITIRYIIIHIVALILMFVLVRSPKDYIYYALISIFASYGGNVLNVFYVRRYVKIKPTLHLDFKLHIVPILILFVNSIATTVYVNSDVVILEEFVSESDVGIYSICSKIYLIVKEVINAITIVALPRLSAYAGAGNKKEFNKLINNLLKMLLVFIFPAVIGLMILSKQIILFASGPEYVSGDKSLKVLSVSLAFAVLACLFANGVLLTQKRDKQYLTGTVSSALLNILLNFIFIPFWGIIGAAVTTLLSEILMVIVCSYKHGASILIKFRYMFSILLGCLGVAVVCLIVTHTISDYRICLITAVLASVIIYFFTLLLLKNETVIEMKESIFSKLKKKKAV